MTKAPEAYVEIYFWHPSLENTIACRLAHLLDTMVEMSLAFTPLTMLWQFRGLSVHT